MGEWISVNDRLPEPTKEVLVAVPMFGKLRCRVGVLSRDEKTWILLGTVEPTFPPIPPTHWMELPAPPSADD